VAFYLYLVTTQNQKDIEGCVGFLGVGIGSTHKKKLLQQKRQFKAGLRTQADVIANQGGDIEELLPQRKAEVEAAQQLGLVFDTDLASTTQKIETNIETSDKSKTNGRKKA
tara:strand:+ start:122 stop:454 length:333 start_codon:yes stop_codon:yes gene_type:complete